MNQRGALISLLVLLLMTSAAAPGPAFGAPPAEVRRVIIDTDPGTDDALAILLALNSPELKVEAITVVPGNVTAEQGLENALRIVSLARRCDIPVSAGAKHPLAQKLITAEFWHGPNGLANIELPLPTCHVDSRFGPDLIIELAHRYPHQMTLVLIGPETNAALALSKDPSIASLMKEVVAMGGSISGGNASAAAEANIYGDPEAAQIVFSAGWPLTMVGLDVGDRTLFDRPRLAELQKTHGPENDFAAGVLKFLIDLSEKYGVEGAQMYDPLAMGVAIDRTLVKTEAMRVDVETRGEFTRGETVANRHNMLERDVPHDDRLWVAGLDPVQPDVQVAVEVEAGRFLQMLIARIEGK